MPCPGCGLAGRKDDSCTHMNCVMCEEIWCYICGKQESELDKADPNRTIYGHNVGWETQPQRRCPMYFFAISDVDSRWPREEEDEE